MYVRRGFISGIIFPWTNHLQSTMHFISVSLLRRFFSSCFVKWPEHSKALSTSPPPPPPVWNIRPQSSGRRLRGELIFWRLTSQKPLPCVRPLCEPVSKGKRKGPGCLEILTPPHTPSRKMGRPAGRPRKWGNQQKMTSWKSAEKDA